MDVNTVLGLTARFDIIRTRVSVDTINVERRLDMETDDPQELRQ